MGWFASKPHDTKDDKRSILGSRHTDIDYRDDTTGKVDRTPGKGHVSGDSRKSNYVDPLSDPSNPSSDVPPSAGSGGRDIPISDG